MVCIIVFGYRSFGKCDYFKLGNSETDKSYYVRTQFFHISFLPLCPVKSYIGTDGGDCCTDKVLMLLPETSSRSILWAWIRAFMFLAVGITMGVAGFTYASDDRPADQIELWKLIVPFALAILFFIAGIALQFYKPKATEEQRQEHVQLILAQVGRVVAENLVEQRAQVVTVPSAHGQSNVQAQVQAKPVAPPAYEETAPAYGYDQAPIQNFQALPSVPNQRNNPNVPNHGGNIV